MKHLQPKLHALLTLAVMLLYQYQKPARCDHSVSFVDNHVQNTLRRARPEQQARDNGFQQLMGSRES